MNLMNMVSDTVEGPRIERVRHEIKIRTVEVAAIDFVTPGMLRITFVGDELADFASLAFDDHVKLLVPDGSGGEERRDYTPRRFDAEARTLAIDFAVHDAGPATRWALAARPGDPLQIAGPKGSAVISPEVRHWLLIGDETALPAIGRRIEEARAGTEITSVVAVAGRQEEQRFETDALFSALWAHRPLACASDPTVLLSALQDVELKTETFVWIAAEADVARAVRAYLLETRRHPKSWTKAGGYWIAGLADAHERIG